MKKLTQILVLLALVTTFAGCDYIYNSKNHYVSIYNYESDKYITSVYFRDYYCGCEYWSKNMVGSFIYPDEYMDILLTEGTYDFKILMEDEYYCYEIDYSSIYVYDDIQLGICYDCYDKSDKNNKAKVTRTPKTTSNNKNQ